MVNIKQTNITNRTYYLVNDMINIEHSDSSLLKIGKKSYRNIDIYYIEYMKIKSISDYKSINSVNPLSFIIGEVDGYIEEKNGNKYLTFASAGKNKEVITKYKKLSDEIKYLNKTISGDKTDKYEKYFMKIKFNSDDNLPLNKILKLHMLTVIVRLDFQDDGQYYRQVFLDEFLYKL